MARVKGQLYPEVDILLPLAARTAQDVSNAERVNPGYGGALVIINTTVIPSSTITLYLEAKDPLSGNWAVIYQAGNISTVSVTRYLFKPGAAGGSGITTVALPLPAVYRFRVEHGDTTSITYSAVAHLLP